MREPDQPVQRLLDQPGGSGGPQPGDHLRGAGQATGAGHRLRGVAAIHEAPPLVRGHLGAGHPHRGQVRQPAAQGAAGRLVRRDQGIGDRLQVTLLDQGDELLERQIGGHARETSGTPRQKIRTGFPYGKIAPIQTHRRSSIFESAADVIG
ncbi:hypothetical protein [Actinoplanes sp. HUAS TT8]|uniref:hypothetical protein n=1 Tax=Actinoplanes sp. HUAS TT8 TaxID=3447453 RepID=UPI003F526EC3